ncbi:MAG: hypothetical protein HY673_03295 [Chloroflexi bacterium]|nr:hypothetical protein [Chloroflexota bacterium]
MPIKAEWIPFTDAVIQDALSLKESGVYEIGKKKGDMVMYIGKSDTSIRQRLLNHKEKTRFSTCTHFRKRKTPSDEAANAEARLLADYRKSHAGKNPPLNTQKPKVNDSDSYIAPAFRRW